MKIYLNKNNKSSDIQKHIKSPILGTNSELSSSSKIKLSADSFQVPNYKKY